MDYHERKDADEVLRQNAALREENAQLKTSKAEVWRELDVAKAEVKRLEGLILNWDDHGDEELFPEVRRIRGEKP